MKKISVVGLSFLLVLLAFSACKPKAGGVAAKAQDLLLLIPKDVQGVIVVDVLNGMKVETVADFMKKAQAEGEFKEFVEKTGVDPQKDIRYLAVGVKMGDGKKQEGVGVVNLKYNKDALLASLKKEGDVQETDYSGVTIYTPPRDADEAEEMRLAFLDEANIIAGSPALVEAVIDIFQGRQDSLRKNAELMPLVNEAKKTSLVWGVFLIPAEAMKETSGQVPMLGNMDALKSVLLSFDYQNQNVLLEIKGKGSDEAKLKQIADMLNGLKAFGGMAAAEKPEIGELLNKIEISAGKDHVTISAVLPEELIKKLVAMAEQMIPKAEPDVIEEPTEENSPDLFDQF
ncbi:MAG: hypothetical protein A2Y56_03090 [Candidatus Aminicenantes bacterium RBG_13_63_10]|nr:MAG: hypothetical protein A2Y56_03090 [Candidatus Aminicenantes bacterium RBG_13_63_10]